MKPYYSYTHEYWLHLGYVRKHYNSIIWFCSYSYTHEIINHYTHSILFMYDDRAKAKLPIIASTFTDFEMTGVSFEMK